MLQKKLVSVLFLLTFTACGFDVGGSTSGIVDPMGPPPEPPPVAECVVDVDCGDEEFCNIENCLPDPHCQTDEGQGCLPVCWGTCEPADVEPPCACEVPPGYCELVCSGEPIPDFPAHCMLPLCACPEPPPAPVCQDDLDCGDEEACVLGVCLPTDVEPPFNACYSDLDCGDEETCIMDVCDCMPGVPCVCHGWCEPAGPPIPGSPAPAPTTPMPAP